MTSCGGIRPDGQGCVRSCVNCGYPGHHVCVFHPFGFWLAWEYDALDCETLLDRVRTGVAPILRCEKCGFTMTPRSERC